MATDAQALAHAPGVSHGGHDAHGAHGHDDHGHHGPLQHQFDDMEQQRECFTLGMWLFLATEIMMFGGLFFAYTLYRGMFDGAFHEGSRHLDTNLGTINTFVLLASSWTMAMAVHSAAEGHRKKLVTFLLITWLFGAAFIGIKAIEWTKDFNEGLVPALNWTFYQHEPEALERILSHGISPDQVKMYFVIYFCMAGLHAIHMIVGLLVVGVMAIMAARGKFDKGFDQPVEIVGLYWHLIDIIWIFLFPLLYLIAGWHPFGAPGGGH